MAFKYTIGIRFWCSSIPGERFKNRKGVGFIMFYPNARFWLTYSTDKKQPYTVYCIYAPLNAEHEYAYDAGAIVVYLRGMKYRQISHLKITIITPFEPRYSNRPCGAVCYKLKKALDVCIVKSTAATLCRRFAGLSTTKLIRYRSKSKFFAKNFQSLPRWRIPPSSVRLFAHQ